MKQIFLIAWREYKQYVFSRGFLIFLLMFPVSLVALTAAMGLVERNRPVRAFVVYDQTGQYADDIDREIERRYMFSALHAWDAYVTSAVEGDVKAVPAPFAPGSVNDGRLKAFRAAGGFDAAREAAAPFLRDGAPAFAMPRRQFERLEAANILGGIESLDGAEQALRPFLLEQRQVASGEGAKPLFAAVLIPEGFGADGGPAAQYWSRNLTDTALQDLVGDALTSALKREAIADMGLSEAALDDVAAISARFDSYRPDREAEEAQLSLKDRIDTYLPWALTYMLLVIIFGVGNLLLTNTIEERSNKIVEILLSSVTAGQLMMGKLIGIAAVGLTMPAIFLFGGFAASFTIASSGENFIAVAIEALFGSPLLLIYLFYFFCAYAIFAMIFLAIGAVSNSLRDAQSYMGPIMLFIFAPMPFVAFIFSNPNGFVATLLTWIPIYTPYAVMMRASSSPPLWEILGATALMLAFAVLLARFMGRIFRNAILQSSPPKAREVWRLAKKEGV